MKSSMWAKILGWFQFAVTSVSQFTAGGAPHGWRDWVTLISSGAVAVALHHSSNTDGTK